MPSEAEVRARWNVSRVTARRALGVLESDHLIDVVPGRGRFVRGDRRQLGDVLFERVAGTIRDDIAAGRFSDGRIPSESALAQMYGCSIGTARMALRLLESSGKIESRRGVGRFVAGNEADIGGPAERMTAALRSDIASGVLEAGQKSPSESELASAHGASRGAVRRALADLEQDGTIYIVQGVGRYVSEAPKQ